MGVMVVRFGGVGAGWLLQFWLGDGVQEQVDYCSFGLEGCRGRLALAVLVWGVAEACWLLQFWLGKQGQCGYCSFGWGGGIGVD